MLNFGILSFPIMFVILSLLINKIKTFTENISSNEPMFFIVPLLLILVIQIINSDADNSFLTIVKRLVIPLVIILSVSKKTYNITKKMQ